MTAVLAAAAAGCGSSDDQPPAGPKALEIYSWLTSGSEGDALKKLLAEVEKTDPGVTITNSVEGRPQDAQAELPGRIQGASPPDSWQQIPGKPIQPYIAAQALDSLDALAASEGWSSAFPAKLLDAARGSDGKLYAVPLNVERDNTLFYNKAMIAAVGATEAELQTIDGAIAVAAKLKAAGKNAFTAGIKYEWTAGNVLIDLLLDGAGRAWVESFLKGEKGTGDTPEVRAALTKYATLMDSTMPERTTFTWIDAVAKVCDGTAAMLFMQDFVKGEFAHDGCGPDMVGYVPVQKMGEDTFVFIGMSWPVAKLAPHRSDANLFLKVVGSQAGQLAFNPSKGSIPARLDIDTTNQAYGFDVISQVTQDQFKKADASGGLMLSWAASTPQGFQDALNLALKTFLDPDPNNADYKNADKVILTLTQQYPSLKGP
jgi:glucose/mannose transport system substrate-binding protein